MFTYIQNIFTVEVLARCSELTREIECGNYSHRPKAKFRSSAVWSVFDQIYDIDNALVNNFFYCTKCQLIKYVKSDATTQLLRHPCVLKLNPNVPNKIDRSDFENLKTSAAKFVCLDLRPFRSVECLGFYEIIMAGVKLGQKYPNLTRDDVISNFPGRKTVKEKVTAEALDSKEQMKCLLRRAIDQGGLGCTIDLWTDRYKHNSYMAMTANFGVVQDEYIEQKRFVFYMGNITEIVKSKPVIKTHIVNTFADFGITEEEIKTSVVLTTDR